MNPNQYGMQRPTMQGAEAAMAVVRRMSRDAERARSLWMLFTIGGALLGFLGLAVSVLFFLLGVALTIGGLIGYGAAGRRARAAQLEEAKMRAWMMY